VAEVARAVEDAIEFSAYDSDYIANILSMRKRFVPERGPLQLTRQQDLLELDLPEADLSVYEKSSNQISQELNNA